MATPVNNIINTISISIDNLFNPDELDDNLNDNIIDGFNKENIDAKIEKIECSNNKECTALAKNIVDNIKKYAKYIINNKTKDKVSDETIQYKYIDYLDNIISHINDFINYVMKLENYIGFDNNQVNQIVIKYINIIKNLINKNINITQIITQKPIAEPIILKPKFTKVEIKPFIKNKYNMKYSDDNTIIIDDIKKIGKINVIIPNIDDYKITIIPSDADKEQQQNFISDFLNDNDNYTVLKNVVNNINKLLENISNINIDFSNINSLDSVIELLVNNYNIKLYDIDTIFNNITSIDEINEYIEKFKSLEDIIAIINNSTSKFDENTYYKLFTNINNNKDSFIKKKEPIENNIQSKVKEIIQHYVNVMINNISATISNVGIFNLIQVFSRGTESFEEYLKDILIECNNIYKAFVLPNLEFIVTDILNEFIVLDTANTSEIYDIMNNTLNSVDKISASIPQNKYIINDKIYKQKYLKYKQKYLQLKNN
jgi:hypothetical protein